VACLDVLLPHPPQQTDGNHEESLRIASSVADISSQYLQNTNAEHYRLPKTAISNKNDCVNGHGGTNPQILHHCSKSLVPVGWCIRYYKRCVKQTAAAAVVAYGYRWQTDYVLLFIYTPMGQCVWNGLYVKEKSNKRPNVTTSTAQEK
jgi:hypothetical protein